MPPTGRSTSLDRVFHAGMRASRRAGEERTSITKAEAERGLRALEVVEGSSSERIRVVQDFLEGRHAANLTPRAREVLAAFISSCVAPAAGMSLLATRAAARAETRAAQQRMSKAQSRLDDLIASAPARAPSALAEVHGWLHAAAADLVDARAALEKDGSDPSARLAARELQAAQRGLDRAAAGAHALAEAPRQRLVPAALAEIARWLSESLPKLQAADARLAALSHDDGDGAGGPVTTMKFPSDNEDGGTGGDGDGSLDTGGGLDTGGSSPASDDGTTATTMKYPSDNEDGGGLVDLGGGARNKDGFTMRRVQQLRSVFLDLQARGALTWHAGGVVPNHLGVRFARVELQRDSTSPGFTYTAYVPLGALTPTAPSADPNQVPEFYVERTGGGLLAVTMSAGPLQVP